MNTRRQLAILTALTSTAALIGCKIDVGQVQVPVAVAPGGITVNPTVHGPTPGQTNPGQVSPPPSATNRNPVFTSFTSNITGLVATGSTITFNVDAADPDGDLLSYAWTTSAGQLSTTIGQSVSWMAPATAGTYTVQVTVTDGKGGQTTSMQTIGVGTGVPFSPVPPSIQPPAPSSPHSPATPSPGPGSETETPNYTTVRGVIHDDNYQPLSNVSVTGQVLGPGSFANGASTLTVTAQAGTYALVGAPIGQNILITVRKSGYTSRQQTIVPVANPQGITTINQRDFGGPQSTGDQTFALSDGPEVQTMTPAPDSNATDPATNFTLTFSEPVNKSDVVNNFALTVANGSYTLSNGQRLNLGYSSDIDDFISGRSLLTANIVYDAAAFTFEWSNNDETVTATFRPGYKLPTDKDGTKLPQYAVGFKGSIRDAAGSGIRSNRFFRISPAQIGKNGYRFFIATDTTAPRLLGVTTINDSPDNGGKDVIRLQFSEAMVLFPGNVMAGSGRYSTTIPAVDDPLRCAANPSPLGYQTTIWRPTDSSTLASDPGTATVWNGDPTNSTISWNLSSNAIVTPGNPIWVGVKGTVEDPAGNALDTTNNTSIRLATPI